MADQRYIVEVIRHDGRWLRQSYVEASSALEAAKLAEPDVVMFTEHDEAPEGSPYVIVSAAPHRPSEGTCSRCGEPRYRCGGETDPHE